MINLLRRADALARAGQRRLVGRIAAALSATLRDASVDVEEAQVVVSGRGIVKRWLIDPSLRFLAAGSR